MSALESTHLNAQRRQSLQNSDPKFPHCLSCSCSVVEYDIELMKDDNDDVDDEEIPCRFYVLPARKLLFNEPKIEIMSSP